jgi:protein gp37
MAKNSSIEWTHHTFNPWWGCTKVSAACDNCYADTWAKRMGHQLWGPKAPRRLFSDTHWREPLVWNEEAKQEGKRHRVFCASMADVFEGRSDLNAARDRLWTLIKGTPHLDWLLLTKRPQLVQKLSPWGEDWPDNVWLGATIESQEMADKRLPHLLRIPAAVRFLSCEPLLGPLDLRDWFKKDGVHPIDWVIAGGESGHGARAMHPKWAESLLKQCERADVPFHFKQWGHWIPSELAGPGAKTSVLTLGNERPVKMTRVPKKLAGRVLRGATWDGVPLPAHA